MEFFICKCSILHLGTDYIINCHRSMVRTKKFRIKIKRSGVSDEVGHRMDHYRRRIDWVIIG